MTDEARLQQQVEELAAASIRALAGERDLHFRGRRLHRNGRALPLFAPHLHPSLAHDDRGSFRGAADGLALRLLHSDAALHATLAPAGTIERFVFDFLEQYRAESLADEALPGVRANLRHRHEAWSLAFHHAGHTDGAAGLLLYTVAQVCRARVNGEAVVEATEDLLEATRAALAPRIGHALAGLRRERHDQAAYAAHANAIASVVAVLLRDAGGGDASESAARADDELRSVFSLLIEPQGDSRERLAGAVSGGSRDLAEASSSYRVFTTAYDREDTAAALLRPAVLAALRERLDALVAGHAVNRPRLVRELRALLCRPSEDGWDSGREEGLIDGRRLAQLVAAPAERRLFRSRRVEPAASAAVTFLLDCSGSMKAHAETLAVLVDTFARALDEIGAASEILGFSTGAWNGGRARRDWLRAGRPALPGRLNERAHIVFKSADASWRRARPQIAGLLQPELYREGIDGEAVDWAASRLAGRDEATKLLVVVSDGSPMDGATRLANDAEYLDRHLRDVVARHERAGEIRVFGIGVGLDLSGFYSHSHVLDLGAAIGNAMFREVIALLAGRHRR